MNGSGQPSVWTIAQLNDTVVQAIGRDPRLVSVWVRGEVSNLKFHSSGHAYFSLKDPRAQVNCTFFKSALARHRGPRLQEGDDVLARGRPSIFGQRGTYQFNVQEIRPAGLGEIRQRLEELKHRLHSEGLFAAARKRRLPAYPLTIGVATAPGGAAVQDIIRVARSRFQDINIIVVPCVVQGPAAAASIASAIALLNSPELQIDVIVAGRGGGSFEDLLPFSDEVVVRAFAASRLPIVSAVGHEIDTPICDFAADAAAPTPSAAAERAVPVMADVLAGLEDSALRLRVSLQNRRRYEAARLQRAIDSPVYGEPVTILQTRAQTLDVLSRELRTYLQNRLHLAHRRLEPSASLNVRFAGMLGRLRGRFELLAERLQNLSLRSTLERGFAIVRTGEGIILRAAEEASAGERLEVLLGRGSLWVAVQELRPDNLSDFGPRGGSPGG